jgi:hypothetical protein
MRSRGIMLLEVGVAITATAVLLYGAVFLFSSFQRIDRTARERVHYGRDLTRLVEQFRTDVHRARDIEEPGEPKAGGNRLLVRLLGDNEERTEYTLGENSQLVRVVANAKKIVERDAFDFGAGTTFSIDVRRDGASLVTLVVSRSGDANGEVNRPTIQRQITALLSRDRRYAAGNDQP